MRKILIVLIFLLFPVGAFAEFYNTDDDGNHVLIDESSLSVQGAIDCEYTPSGPYGDDWAKVIQRVYTVYDSWGNLYFSFPPPGCDGSTLNKKRIGLHEANKDLNNKIIYLYIYIPDCSYNISPAIVTKTVRDKYGDIIYTCYEYEDGETACFGDADAAAEIEAQNAKGDFSLGTSTLNIGGDYEYLSNPDLDDDYSGEVWGLRDDDGDGTLNMYESYSDDDFDDLDPTYTDSDGDGVADSQDQEVSSPGDAVDPDGKSLEGSTGDDLLKSLNKWAAKSSQERKDLARNLSGGGGLADGDADAIGDAVGDELGMGDMESEHGSGMADADSAISDSFGDGEGQFNSDVPFDIDNPLTGPDGIDVVPGFGDSDPDTNYLAPIFDLFMENNPVSVFVGETDIQTSDAVCSMSASVDIVGSSHNVEFTMCQWADELSAWGNIVTSIVTLGSFIMVFRK